jgi:uncharacterized protein (DUF885 family)
MTDAEGRETPARDLADRFHRRWLEENPFTASMYGIPGYDDRVPDDSEPGQQAWRAEIVRYLEEAAAIESGPLAGPDAVTLDCTIEAATNELETIDMARAEYTVTAMPYSGPAAFLAAAARTVLLDPAAAEAYLTRLRLSGAWIDQNCDRLRAGAAGGGSRWRRSSSRPSAGPRACWPHRASGRCCRRSRRRTGPGRRRGRRNAGRSARRW